MRIDTDFITRILEEDQGYLFLCDSDFKITDVGAHAVQSGIGVSPNRTLREIFPGCHDELAKARRRLETGMPFHSTKFELFPFQSTIFMIPILEEGRLSSVLCYLEIPAEAGASPEPSRYLSMVSDRYRTPIFNLLNTFDALAPEVQISENYTAIQRMNDGARYCYQILRTSKTVCDYHSLVNGNAPFHPQWQDLTGWLQNFLQTLQVMICKTPRKLDFTAEEPSGGAVFTFFDDKLLSLALFHLLLNAYTFSPEESTVRVALAAQGDTARITVADNGNGISREDQLLIFEPFFTKHDTPIPEEEMGMGLGLPIVKRIAELHGGRIFATSELNHGTTMALTLPIREPDGPQATRMSTNMAAYMSNRYSDLYVLFYDLAEIHRY